MTATTTRGAANRAASRYSPRSVVGLAALLLIGAAVTGSWLLAACVAGMAVAALALIWALDVLTGRRSTRHGWAAWVIAVASGGALLAVIGVAVEQVLS